MENKEDNGKAIVGYTSFPSVTQASRKLDNIQAVAGNTKWGGPEARLKCTNRTRTMKKQAKTIATPMKEQDKVTKPS